MQEFFPSEIIVSICTACSTSAWALGCVRDVGLLVKRGSSTKPSMPAVCEGSFAVILQQKKRAVPTGGTCKISSNLLCLPRPFKGLEGEVLGPSNLLA